MRRTVPTTTLLIAVALVASLAGCAEQEPPEAQPVTTTPTSTSPSPAPPQATVPDSPETAVNCSVTPNDPKCTVEVVYTGDGNRNNGGGGGLVCRIGGEVVECQNEFGWLGSDGCYYGKDPGTNLAPNQWTRTCFNFANGFASQDTVLLLDPPLALDLINNHRSRRRAA